MFPEIHRCMLIILWYNIIRKGGYDNEVQNKIRNLLQREKGKHKKGGKGWAMTIT